MAVYEHLTEYDGLPVVGFGEGAGLAPATAAWAVCTGYEGDPFQAVLADFLEDVDSTAVTHLVIGHGGEALDSSDPVVQALVEAAPRLPGLRAVFLGDIVSEECEISWIRQSDITPLLDAFPGLERLDVRGGSGLWLSPMSSSALRVLRLESGGLPAGVVRAVGASDLPNLHTLELWLGTGDYGGDAAIADLAPILSGEKFPALRRLGLMDSEIQDDICAAVATAPVVAQLSELVLSMGVLTDDGAGALLSGQPLTHLRLLDLRHHFMTEPMVARLRAALPQVQLEIDAAEDDHDGEWRFVAVSE